MIAAREPHGRAVFFCGQAIEPVLASLGLANENFRGTDLAFPELENSSPVDEGQGSGT
jgi:hypothetical protein